MALLTPKVIETLIRIAKGEIDPAEVDRATALTVLAICADPRKAAHVMATLLNDRGETFDQIAAAIKEDSGVEVHRATVARWAQPPGPDRRRRRREEAGD